MLPLPRRKRAWLLSSLLLLAATTGGHAQDGDVRPPSDAFPGSDDPAFERLFGEALRRKPPPAYPINSAAMLASNVTELRLFLTEEPGIVRGEIVAAGPSTLAAFSVAMEEGTVVFRDDGAEPDQVGGDGVFTARFKLDTTGEFETLRAGLRETIEILRKPSQDILIRRGPRDIVTAADAIRDAEREMPEALNMARQEADRAARLLDFEDPLRAAEALEIDIDTTPFLRLPGGRFDPLERKRFKVEDLFDFPIFGRFPPPLPVAIDHERSLLITATDVIEDPMRSFDACSGTGAAGGAWSFGHLMRELAHGTGLTPEEFTLHWLSNWQILQEANGWIVNESTRAQNLQTLVIDVWQRLSPPGGVLDVDYFPARLLAIVNRPDLADRIGYGAAGSAGEGRLVFGLVYKDPNDGSCSSLRFTVIFEYGVAANSCSAVKAWQRRWKNLDQHPLGSADYNQDLEDITRDFTDHGSNPGQLPNMSLLGQLRTNETALSSPWQLREFRLQETGLLDLVTVKQTPHNQFENQQTLRDYLGDHEADILNDRHVVSERFPGVLDPFLGAVSNTLFQSFFWTAPNLGSLTDPAETRRKFSLATCNGCHSGETLTLFTHIGNEGRRDMHAPASLSGFLVGETVTVPVTGGTRRYEDLTEREAAMSDLLTRSCFLLLGVRRLPFVH